MSFRIITATIAAVLGLSCFTPVAKAGTLVTATDVGWYNSDGVHYTFAKGFVMGYAGAMDGLTYRAYFDFNLAGVTQTISSASLQIFSDAGGYDSPNSYEKLALYDVTTPISTLKGPAYNSVNTFNDLGSGTIYGQTMVSTANDDNWVSVGLNSAAVSALNAARGREFAIGGAIPSLNMLGTAINELIFEAGYAVSQVRLNLNFAPVTTAGAIGGASAVPEPSTMVGLVSAAVFGLVAGVRRRRSA